MTARIITLTHERLQELLHYDPDTGLFTWRVRTSNRVLIGGVAGTISPKGYVRIKLDGKLYSAHVLAWFYITGRYPTLEIDHENRIKSDNKFNNLREATHSQNAFNRDIQVNNTSGATGVCWNKHHQKWQVRLTSNKKTVSLGFYVSMEEAIQVRRSAEGTYFGEFRRHYE